MYKRKTFDQYVIKHRCPYSGEWEEVDAVDFRDNEKPAKHASWLRNQYDIAHKCNHRISKRRVRYDSIEKE